MFIPLEMRRDLRDVTVPGADGRQVPLVASERTVFESTATYGRESPPRRLPVYHPPAKSGARKPATRPHDMGEFIF